MGSRGPAGKGKDKSSIRFRPGVPPAPDWLDDDAKAEYARAATELEAADGALQQVDLHALANYAQAASDIARLTREIRSEGEVVTLPNKIRMKNPKIDVKKIAQQQLLALIAQLGFSPAARARVPKSAATGKSSNPFAAYVDGVRTEGKQ